MRSGRTPMLVVGSIGMAAGAAGFLAGLLREPARPPAYTPRAPER